jgi:hypothetical protein
MEKVAIHPEIEELQKVEMSELLLQFSSGSQSSDSNQEL